LVDTPCADICSLFDRQADLETLHGTQSSTRKHLSTKMAMLGFSRDTLLQKLLIEPAYIEMAKV